MFGRDYKVLALNTVVIHSFHQDKSTISLVFCHLQFTKVKVHFNCVLLAQFIM